MHFKSLTTTLLILATSSILAAALPEPGHHPHPKCGTCNPLSGQNSCDITTSCINTGKEFHCACRAGYKADAKNHDMSKHFRLPFENYEFLVFVPENTACNVLCKDYTQAPPKLCSEVPLYSKCEA